ncbi:uncharacterized protein LOC129589987 [Paramacrobiotus metropolitanus]|uniref:uncharacterized protein LOC129589987 n=1 Tax=Paramacrobiotus metropolitanus TaxID=2943436 RepID=UPI0024459BBA|nr:uncharacterized protein LOC129589987 [Paramacrobiotus metropolitanus]
MTSSIQRSLWALGDFLSSKNRLMHSTPPTPTGIALLTLDYERETDPEFEIIREKLNKVTQRSRRVRHILLWDRLHNILDSPFHHTMQIMQKHNVQALCLLLKYTEETTTLRTLRKLVGCFWSRNMVSIEDQCFPPLPLCVVVYVRDEKHLQAQISKSMLKKLILLEIAPVLPAVFASVPKEMHFIKIKFVCKRKEYDLIADESAEWLAQVAKRYVKYCEERNIWATISWDKVLQRERGQMWKNLAKSFALAPNRLHRFKLKRSQSEPAIAPRRKPFISDEISASFDEEAAAIAVQLKHYQRPQGIWAHKHPRAEYLHKIFLELNHLREAARIKLIHRRQYFQRSGMHRGFTSPMERFYTRFQWIKSHSRDKTDQLIIYFHYGTVIQFNIARMKQPLTPSDIQILRHHLLAHSEAKKHRNSRMLLKHSERDGKKVQTKET